MKAYLKVLLLDALLLIGLFYVTGDLQWRVAYAATPHGHTAGYSPSLSYSVFTQVFTMAGSGASLASPLTLDWVQVLATALVILNGWYLYTAYAARRKGTLPNPGQ